MGNSPVKIYHLEMIDPAAFRRKAAPVGFAVRRVDPPDWALNRRMYETVGRAWKWTDRLVWSDQQWRDYAAREYLQTWIAVLDEEMAGYVELESQPGGAVQIVYFGLLPEFIGRGLGGAFLSAAIEQAWNTPGAERVWVHTCTEDHEHALANYQRRGFTVFKEVKE